MSSEWPLVKFHNVIELVGGGTPKTTESSFWNGVIPWLSVADFNSVPRWVSGAEKSITELGLAQSSTKLLNAGDIIISARGTVGALAQLGRPMAFNQSCYGVRGISGVADTNFIFYALKLAVKSLKQLAHGGVFDTITRDTFKSIDLLLPSIKEQRAIAHILGTLDDKIELNRKQNETLEAMARALFKSWFIDFDPVRAKMEGRAPAGLDAATAALFPDAFEETELGMVPKGWQIAPVYSIATVTYGAPFASKLFKAKPPGTLLAAVEASETATTVIHLGKNDIDRFKITMPPSEVLKRFSTIANPIYDRFVKNKQQIQTLANLRDTLLPKLISGEMRVSDAEQILSETEKA
ncbi:restriction endonuclease subunit S [Comamonadaceae bacterium M7527]|nr:restriction endonuclease subunit S [Comamonadaceae bacterium M7527]